MTNSLKPESEFKCSRPSFDGITFEVEEEVSTTIEKSKPVVFLRSNLIAKRQRCCFGFYSIIAVWNGNL